MNNSVLDLVGNTPLVKAKRLLDNPKVELYFKLEGQNPGGSVKDRAAYNMIKSALDRGDIDKNTKLIEATSGNTGIALAMIAGIFGLDIELVMPENSTIERVQTMEAYGAKVILTDAEIGIEGSRDYAEEKMAGGDYFMINQFSNNDNWRAHYNTTGPEIWDQLDGKVDAVIASQGTGGWVSGAGKFMREKNPEVLLYAVEPEECPLLSRRGWGPHGIEGIGDGFVPKALDLSLLSGIVTTTTDESIKMAQRLAKEEGIFCGISSGVPTTAYSSNISSVTRLPISSHLSWRAKSMSGENKSSQPCISSIGLYSGVDA